MATEKLIVELDAKTARLDARLINTEKRLDSLADKTEKSDNALKKFGKGSATAAGIVLKLATAAVALSGAITGVVVASAKSRVELERLSKQAKTSTSDFQALSFATGKYGIDGEKMADISKDIADRIGEFSAAGTGAFQDYADVMKMSKTEAANAAREFEGLSSQEVLGRMIDRMEDAGVSGDKMTFVMESISGEASRLIPLFAGNGKELETLKKRFNDVNDSLQITGTQAEELKKVSSSFTLMTSTMGNATTAISATLAPVINDFFNDIIDIVPDATQTIIDFANSFLDAENITSIAGVNKEIAASLDVIATKEEKIAGIRDRIDSGNEQMMDAANLAGAEHILKVEQERLANLRERLKALQDSKELEDAQRLEGGEIGGETGDPLSTGGTTIIEDEERERELQALLEFTQTRAEILDQQLIDDLERLTLAGEELGITEGELYQRRLEIIKDFADKKEALENKKLKDKEKGLKKEEKWSDSSTKKMMDDGTQLLTSLGNNSKTAHKIKQGLAASNAFMNTAEGVTDALASQNYASAAIIAATGAAQIAAILSSSPDSPSGGGSTPPASAPQQQQQDFQPDTTSLELSSATTGGAGQQTIRFATDSGDELIDTIASLINKGQQQGRYA